MRNVITSYPPMCSDSLDLGISADFLITTISAYTNILSIYTSRISRRETVRRINDGPNVILRNVRNEK